MRNAGSQTSRAKISQAMPGKVFTSNAGSQWQVRGLQGKDFASNAGFQGSRAKISRTGFNSFRVQALVCLGDRVGVGV